MVYLDYRIHKAQDHEAKRLQEVGIEAINRILPAGTRLHRVTSEGRIIFKIGNQEIPTVSLSDGYRSVLALAGDLIWRLLLAFPGSKDPLKENGVVLIDELDIHLHPVWQRELPEILRELFPNLQFFVATHVSEPPVFCRHPQPSHCGPDAATYRFDFEDGKSEVKKIKNLAPMTVDRVLQSEAFGLVSPYVPATEKKINRWDSLRRKKHRSQREEDELISLYDFMGDEQPIGGPPEPGSLDEKIETCLRKTFDDQSETIAETAHPATQGNGVAREPAQCENEGSP